MFTKSDLEERGFIRRVFESSVASAFSWDRSGERQGGREAFVAQVGERLGGDINMHGYLNALVAPNLDVLLRYLCCAMPTCPDTRSHWFRKSSQRPWKRTLCEIGDFSKRKFLRKWDWRPMERVAVRFSRL